MGQTSFVCCLRRSFCDSIKDFLHYLLSLSLLSHAYSGIRLVYTSQALSSIHYGAFCNFPLLVCVYQQLIIYRTNKTIPRVVLKEKNATTYELPYEQPHFPLPTLY